MRNRLAALLVLGLIGPGASLAAQQPVPRVAAAWQAIGDTTLERLVATALDANFDLVAAGARVAEARAARARAGWELAPSVAVVGSYTRQRIGAAVFPGLTTRPPDRDLWDAGIEASWEVDLFGRLRAGWRGQRAALIATEADREAVALLVSGEVVRSYTELRGLQSQLQVLDANLHNLRQALALTEERLAAGRGTALDTERARAQVALTDASRRDVQVAADAAVARLGALLAQPAAMVVREVGAAGPVPTPPALDATLPVEALVAQRPDVVAAGHRVRAAEAQRQAARAAYLPRLTLVGTAGTVSTERERLWGAGTSRFAVGPVVSWPIFNLGRIGADVRAASARRDVALADRDRAVVEAAAEVHATLARYRGAHERVGLLRGAAEASRRAAELSLLRFESGASDFLQVLDTERTRLAAEAQLVAAEQERGAAYVAAVQALGGRVSP